MSEHIDPDPFDPDPFDPARFFHVIRDTAAAIAVPFDDPLVRKTLDVFDTEMGRSVVQLKATSKAGSGLSYRFFGGRWGDDLIGITQRHGLLRSGDAIMITLQREIIDKFPDAKRAGFDFGVGLAKSWTTTAVRPIEDLFDLPAVPDAVRTHADFFARHELRRIFGVASDFPGETMNLYPIVEPDCRNTDWLRRLVEETGGASEDTPGYPKMIASLTAGACLGMTFSWDSPELRRWSLYGLGVPYLDAQASAALPTLPPRLKTFLEQASTLSPNPPINVAWSFGKAGFYTKLSVGGLKVQDPGGAPSRQSQN